MNGCDTKHKKHNLVTFFYKYLYIVNVHHLIFFNMCLKNNILRRNLALPE